MPGGRNRQSQIAAHGFACAQPFANIVGRRFSSIDIGEKGRDGMALPGMTKGVGWSRGGMLAVR